MPNGDHGGQATDTELRLNEILRHWYHGTPRQQENALKELRTFIAKEWAMSHIREKR
jgi:hypothetical protein